MTTLTLPKAGSALAPERRAIQARQPAWRSRSVAVWSRCARRHSAHRTRTGGPPRVGDAAASCPPGQDPVSPSPPPPSYFFK